MRFIIFIIVAVVAVAAGYLVVMPKVETVSANAQVTAADSDINTTLKTELTQYFADTGGYPGSLHDLVVAPAGVSNWRGPYLPKDPVDPWGNAYIYHCPGGHNPSSYDLMSAGPDGKEGTDDDIVNWTK